MDKLCKECKDKKCIKEKKPCKLAEKYLRGFGIKSVNWIRPRISHRTLMKERKLFGRDLGRWRELPTKLIGQLKKHQK